MEWPLSFPMDGAGFKAVMVGWFQFHPEAEGFKVVMAG